MNILRHWDMKKDAALSYCPIMLANGSLCTLLDYHGDQPQNTHYATYGNFDNFKQMPACMYRAGLRRNTVERDLIPLGHFEETFDGVRPQLQHASQTLDLGCGSAACSVELENTGLVRTEAFLHKQDTLFLIRKYPVPGHAYAFHYYFSEPYSHDQVAWSDFHVRRLNGGREAVCSWKTAGRHGDVSGEIRLLCSAPAVLSVEGCCVSFTFDNPPDQLDFALIYTDSCCDGADYQKKSARLRRKVLRLGYDGLMKEQEALWASFWNTFHVALPDPDLQSTFETALYTLESSFTAWSIPVSINNAAWRGNYFAFNLFTEIFLAAGHPEKAVRIPTYRRNILPAAWRRARGHAQDEARYVWICDEEGQWDASIAGIWYDHIQHMANIAEEAWNCYLYTRDRKLLEEVCYPILKSCANFYLREAVYPVDSDTSITGSFCDLERMGGSVRNGMLTGCAAIGTLEWSADAADVLQLDAELSAQWRETARKLRSGLPNDGQKYLSCSDPSIKSIGALGGFHPYPVLTEADPFEQAALDDFCKDTSSGNMYAVGKGLCTWYADWVAISMFRSHRTAEGIRYLHSAFDKTGAFNAVFEINEPGAFVSFPWCSAPNASYAQAVIQMLVWWDYDLDTLQIGSGYPEEWKDLSFTLRAPDDLTVRYERKDGQVTRLILTAGPACEGSFRQVCVEGNVYPLQLHPGESRTLIG